MLLNILLSSFLFHLVVCDVTFDPTTGSGVVPKSDVVSGFGWSDEELQTKTRTVQFNVLQKARSFWLCKSAITLSSFYQGSYLKRYAGLKSRMQTNPDGEITGFELIGYKLPDPMRAVRTVTAGPKLRQCRPENTTYVPGSLRIFINKNDGTVSPVRACTKGTCASLVTTA